MKNRKMNKRIIWLGAALIIFVVIAIMSYNYYTFKNRLVNANLLIEKIYTDVPEQYTIFSGLEKEQQKQWIESNYAPYMTKAGLDRAMQNRVLLIGINEFRLTQQEVEIEDVIVEKRSGNETENWYNYKVIRTGQENVEKEIVGSFEIMQEDGKWLVNQITSEH